MRTRAHAILVSAFGSIRFVCFSLILCSSTAFGISDRPSKVVCRDDLSLTRRHELESKLRAITGWDNLTFDRNGTLQVDDKISGQGSSAARMLIRQITSGHNVVILEDASNRHDVVFSRVVPGRWIDTSRDNPPAYVVLIDFADFDHLIGDKAALKAFDVGWALLHEFDHVVNDSQDADDLHDAGECEAHINKMREECDLPLRAEYFYTLFPHTEESEFKTRFVRLAFDQQDAASTKHRRYWVMWDATLVGALSQPNLVATLNR